MTDADFLAEILAHPEDDGPRLVYADWLDEQDVPVACGRCVGEGREPAILAVGGFGTMRCTRCDGKGVVPGLLADRAEFIRVQCELARIPSRPDCTCPDNNAPHHLDCPDRTWVLRYLARYDTLRRRDGELLDKHGLDWVLPLARALGVSEEAGHYKGNRYHAIGTHRLNLPQTAIDLVWRRGFVARVSLTMEALMGGVCGRCNDGFVWEDYWGGVAGKDLRSREVRCSNCHGTGRLSGLAATLGTLPLDADGVRVTGREPYPIGGRPQCFWSHPDVPGDGEYSTIPEPIFLLLDGYHNRGTSAALVRWYNTREDALSALAVTATLYCQQEAAKVSSS